MSSIGRTIVGWSRGDCSVAAAISVVVGVTSVAGICSIGGTLVLGVAIGVASRKHPKLVLVLVVPRALVPTVVVASVGHGGLVKRRAAL